MVTEVFYFGVSGYNASPCQTKSRQKHGHDFQGSRFIRSLKGFSSWFKWRTRYSFIFLVTCLFLYYIQICLNKWCFDVFIYLVLFFSFVQALTVDSHWVRKWCAPSYGDLISGEHSIKRGNHQRESSILLLNQGATPFFERMNKCVSYLLLPAENHSVFGFHSPTDEALLDPLYAPYNRLSHCHSFKWNRTFYYIYPHVMCVETTTVS